jgi:hypothetical protein
LNLNVNLHPGPDVDIAGRNGISAKELVSTKTIAATSDLDGVLSTVSSSLVENNTATLITVRRVLRPSDLVPTALKVLGDLAEGERKHRECSKSNLAKHGERIENIQEKGLKNRSVCLRMRMRAKRQERS